MKIWLLMEKINKNKEEVQYHRVVRVTSVNTRLLKKLKNTKKNFIFILWKEHWRLVYLYVYFIWSYCNINEYISVTCCFLLARLGLIGWNIKKSYPQVLQILGMKPYDVLKVHHLASLVTIIVAKGKKRLLWLH